MRTLILVLALFVNQTVLYCQPFAYDKLTKTVTYEGVDTVYVNGINTPYLIEYCDSNVFDSFHSASIFLDKSSSMTDFLRPNGVGRKSEVAAALAKKIIHSPNINQYGVSAGNSSNSILINLTYDKSIADSVIDYHMLRVQGWTNIRSMIIGDSGLIQMSRRAEVKRLAIIITDGEDGWFQTWDIIDSLKRYNITAVVFLTQLWYAPAQTSLQLITPYYFSFVDSARVEEVYDSLRIKVNRYPCRIKFLLDSCEPSWHIRIGSFDTVVVNDNYSANTTFTYKRDTLYFKPCQKDSLITISGKSHCKDTSYALRVTQSGEFAEVIFRDSVSVVLELPDTLYLDPCKVQSFTVFRTKFYCDSTIIDSLIFPYGQTSYTAFDTTFSVLFISQYKDSLLFDKKYSLAVSICDTGQLFVPVTNEGCLPGSLRITGSGSFVCNVFDTTVPPFSEIKIPFTYYPTGNSVYLFNGDSVFFYGSSWDSSYTVRPDTIEFTRTVCDSSPELYSITTYSCDTSVWDGAFLPILTAGSHSDTLDGIHFVYTVTDSSREEFYLDSCGGGYSLLIGCDTVITLYPQTIDTIRAFITHEYIDSQKVLVNAPFPVNTSTDLFVWEYNNEWRFYMGKDSFAVLTLTIPEKPCTVYITEPDTVYYRYFCGDGLIKGLLDQTTFKIYPNPTNGGFRIEPEPESVEIYFNGVQISDSKSGFPVSNLNTSGTYFVIVNHRIVLKLIVE